MADSLDQLDAFMAAIRKKESGGNYEARNGDSGARGAYQFMPATYRGAAKAAGVDPNDWSPESQDKVARSLMTQYFNQFGSWRSVAISWYGGPKAVKYSQSALNRPQGGGKYPSINDYANSVVSSMGSEEGGETTGSPPTEEEVVALIQEQYPEYAFLLNDPEIRRILVEATNPEGGLDDAALMSRIRATQWYQQHGENARSWEALTELDPATAARQVDQAVATLRARAVKLGVQMSDSELVDLAERSLRFGFNEAEITAELATMMAGDEPAGAVYGTVLQLRSLANDYLVEMSENDILRWSQQIITGQTTIEDFQKATISLAKAKFSGNQQMTQMLDEGTSPEGFFRGHKNLIASEWDMSPDQVNLMDPQWNNVLQTDVDGMIRPMTLAETRKHMRLMEGWDQTTTGKRKSAEMGLELLTKMGMVSL